VSAAEDGSRGVEACIAKRVVIGAGSTLFLPDFDPCKTPRAMDPDAIISGSHHETPSLDILFSR